METPENSQGVGKNIGELFHPSKRTSEVSQLWHEFSNGLINNHYYIEFGERAMNLFEKVFFSVEVWLLPLFRRFSPT